MLYEVITRIIGIPTNSFEKYRMKIMAVAMAFTDFGHLAVHPFIATYANSRATTGIHQYAMPTVITSYSIHYTKLYE